ncbi:hypothetical protein FNJ87_09665 [Nonlabens mediterrranea]|uniref:Uncharacterized protein n=1 Tax=Nonlabens mediterrranea TaxID=1419947 RepID=A0ABS0A627_9FLAO|nr:hypothetical protein [Nonlabens mediterrranea]
MKYLLTFSLFMICHLALKAQYQEGIIIFNNNTSKAGFIKTRANDSVKFKENEEDETVVYDHKHIIGFDIDGLKYRYVRTNRTDPPSLYIEIENGKIVLYGLYMQGGTSSIGFGPGSNLQPVYVDRESYTLYFMVIDDRFVRIGTKLKKRHLKMLKDCPELVSKLENGNMKKKRIPEAIEFYNNNCGD